MAHSSRRSFAALFFAAMTLVTNWAQAAFDVVSGSYKYEDRVVVAGPSGAALKYPSGLTIELSPGARLRQLKDMDLWMASGGKTPTEIFALADGRVRVLRPAREGKTNVAALVVTSRKLMGVTVSGEFIAISGKTDGIIAGYSGAILVGTGNSWQKLPEAQYGKMSKGQAKIAFMDLPKAPALHSSKSLWMALQGKAAIEGMTWNKGSSDAQFKVTVVRSDTKEAAASITSTEPSLPNGSLTLGAGSYEARVQAMNSFGLIGPYSAPINLRIVGVRTHRGARVDSRGTVHLAANQRAEFQYVDGLLMTYGGSSRWAPATASVPLRDNEPVFVHFREPDSADVVSARLEPRGVVADVFVGSKMAQWPGDKVDVVVRLRDESGELTDDAIVPHFEVTLGIEPLALKWERSGATWRASIPAPTGPGPWVIRAAVTDEHGVELGRDFLEVAERPGAPSTARAHLQASHRQGRPIARAH